MRRLLSCRRGTAALEFGLVAPMYFALLLGIVEFGFQMWTRVSLDYALAQTARCYVIGYVDAGMGTNCASLSGAKSYFQTLATGISFANGALSLTNPSAGCLSYHYTASWLIAGIMPVAVPAYTGTACYYF